MNLNDTSMGRRQYILTTTAVICGVGIAGCTSEEASDETTADDTGRGDSTETTEEDETEGVVDSIRIDYSISDGKTHKEIPSEVVKHPNPEGFFWVVIEFELVNGEFDANDIVGLTQLRAGDSTHFTRAVIITSPDEKTLTSTDSEYMMPAGTTGKAYYRLSDKPSDSEWVIEQLRNQHGDVEIRQQSSE